MRRVLCCLLLAGVCHTQAAAEKASYASSLYNNGAYKSPYNTGLFSGAGSMKVT